MSGKRTLQVIVASTGAVILASGAAFAFTTTSDIEAASATSVETAAVIISRGHDPAHDP